MTPQNKVFDTPDVLSRICAILLQSDPSCLLTMRAVNKNCRDVASWQVKHVRICSTVGLAASKNFANLSTLVIRSSKKDTKLRGSHLPSLPFLRTLTTLRLGDVYHLRDKYVRSIAARFPSLTEITLWKCSSSVTFAGIAAALKPLTRLASLTIALPSRPVTESSDFAVLVESLPPRLESFHVHAGCRTSKGISIDTGVGRLKMLTALWLNNFSLVSLQSLITLAEQNKTLREVKLGEYGYVSRWAMDTAFLAALTKHCSLRSLCLTECDLTDVDVETMAKISSLRSLEFLDCTGFTDGNVVHLEKLAHLRVFCGNFYDEQTSGLQGFTVGSIKSFARLPSISSLTLLGMLQTEDEKRDLDVVWRTLKDKNLEQLRVQLVREEVILSGPQACQEYEPCWEAERRLKKAKLTTFVDTH